MVAPFQLKRETWEPENSLRKKREIPRLRKPTALQEQSGKKEHLPASLGMTG